jgi:hypothetical protein
VNATACPPAGEPGEKVKEATGAVAAGSTSCVLARFPPQPVPSPPHARRRTASPARRRQPAGATGSKWVTGVLLLAFEPSRPRTLERPAALARHLRVVCGCGRRDVTRGSFGRGVRAESTSRMDPPSAWVHHEGTDALGLDPAQVARSSSTTAPRGRRNPAKSRGRWGTDASRRSERAGRRIWRRWSAFAWLVSVSTTSVTPACPSA